MKLFIPIILFLLVAKAYSQTDSLTTNINKIIRPRNLLSVNYYWTNPYKLKNSNDIIVDGVELNNNQGYAINGMLPIYVPKKGHVRLMADYSFLSTTFENSEVDINNSFIDTFDSDRYVTRRYSISPTMIVNYKINSRTVVHMLKLNLNSYDFFKPSHFSVFLSSSVILKSTAKKSSAIGLALIYSDNTEYPVIPFPIYTYNSFLNPKWTFEMTLPYSIGIRRIQNNKFNIKADLKLDVLSSLFKPQYYNEVARFSDLGIAAGVKFEYKVHKYITWNATAMYKYSFGTKIIDNDSGNDVYEFDPNSKLMINMGFSFSL